MECNNLALFSDYLNTSKDRAVKYKLGNNKTLTVYCKSNNNVNISNNNKLFADNIWPGAYVLSDILDNNKDILCRNKAIIELGAGCSLPSIVSASLDATLVVITDYPDVDIINNIKELIDINQSSFGNTPCLAIAHEWGSSVYDLLSVLNSDAIISNTPDATNINSENDSEFYLFSSNINKYDVVLVAEPLWKDTVELHNKLLQSIVNILSQDGICIVTFAHRITSNHRKEDDLQFFAIANEKYNLYYTYKGFCSRYKDLHNNSNENVDTHIYILHYTKFCNIDIIVPN